MDVGKCCFIKEPQLRMLWKRERTAERDQWSECGRTVPVPLLNVMERPHRTLLSFGDMNRIAIESHRGLLYALFGFFETLLDAAVAVVWSVDPRRMSGVDDAAGITVWFSPAKSNSRGF